MAARSSVYLRPSDLARLLGMSEGAGLHVPKLDAIAHAVGLALEALEDRTGEEWRAAGVEVHSDGVNLHFRLRRVKG